MKKALWITPLSALLFFFGAFYFAKPYLSSLANRKLTEYVERQTQLKISIQEIDVSFFLPKISFINVSIPKSVSGLEAIEISSVEAFLDIPDLIAGQFSISEVWINGLATEVNIDLLQNQKSQNETLPIKELFEFSQKIPVRKILARSWRMDLKSEKYELEFNLANVFLLLKNQKNQIELRGILQNQRKPSNPTPHPDFSLTFQWALSPTTLSVSELNLSYAESNISIKSEFKDPERLFIQPKGEVEYQLQVDVLKTLPFLSKIFDLPKVMGRLQSEGKILIESPDKATFKGLVKTKNLKINNYWVGDASFEARYQDHQFESDLIQIKNPGGRISLKDFFWDLRKENSNQPQIKSDITIHHLDLHDLLVALDVGDIPLELMLGGSLNCKGTALPQLSINCSAKLNAHHLEVRSGEKVKDIIVSLDEFSAQGDLQLTDKEVNYRANLAIAENQGSSQGIISFSEGFQISFETPKLSLANISSLARLKLQGDTSIKGTTSGDSSSAAINLTFASKDLFLEDYFLGDPSGTLTYKKGVLSFDQVISSFESGQVRADVDINVIDQTIALNAESASLSLSETASVFNRLYEFPLPLLGQLQFNAKVWGPLILNQLSLEAQASLKNPVIGTERFDRGEFIVSSDRGNFEIKQAQLLKNKSTLSVSGLGFPDGNINFLVRGNRFTLQESELATSLNSDISGLLDFSMNLEGPLLSPEVKVNARLSDLLIAQEEFQNSEASVRFSKKQVEGSAQLFNGKIKSQFRIPYQTGTPLEVSLNTFNWDFTKLASLLGGSDLVSSYQSSLSSKIQLQSNSGSFTNLTGLAEISQLMLQRENLQLKNNSVAALRFDNGQISLKNFDFEGVQTSIKLKGENFSLDQLDFEVRGQSNLRLFHIFLPFLEEFSGFASLSTKVRGSLFKPDIFGEAQIKNGFAKIKNFPHAFEQISANLQFSQNKVNLESITGLLASGNLKGDGVIEIKNRDLDVNVKAQLTNANFNIPDQVQTTGNAEVTLTGNWFPFVLSGTYHVQGGSIRKEFEDEDTKASVKPSSYLPKMILQKAFDPIELDFQIQLDRPLTIKNSLIDGQIEGSLKVQGPPRAPILLGKISMSKQSKLTFRDKVFDVITGTLNFNDPTALDPEIYLTARSRINEFDINMLAQGKSKNRLIRLSSVPPMAEKDIISLLALGITSDNLEKKSTNLQTQSNAYNEIGAQILANTPLSKNLQQNLGVDLQISNQYDDTKGAAVQKITISRKINEKVNASASRLQGKQTSTEVKLQYKINNNVSAIGTYETRSSQEDTSTSGQDQGKSQSIFGLDLEYKRDFK